MTKKRKLYTPMNRSKGGYEVLIDGETEWQVSNASTIRRAVRESGLSMVNAGQTVTSEWGHQYRKAVSK